MFFRKKENSTRLHIPEDSITPADIHKFLIRSAIIVTPHLWRKYESVIHPLILEGEQSFSLESIWKSLSKTKEETLFDNFVNQVCKLKAKFDSENARNNLSLTAAEQYRDEAVALARSFCDRAEKQGISSQIFPQLETIAGNIALRNVVNTYSETKQFRKGYGTIQHI
ncbi:hypothetical protein [Aquicella lusitana]|uniref:Uncharacterized protein n=1 Tax=Aquicella lusitana TaxID=254246 RepID=A0A370GFX6_9COXI|nr:hypothetical protein [Aquicella lusitana]RDI42705.1 hypothetical protein C8D86_11334 [Aquicella lusitana]VVC73440.1 hypothetical protein AQULUS_11800 [Aquicella lusitana]